MNHNKTRYYNYHQMPVRWHARFMAADARLCAFNSSFIGCIYYIRRKEICIVKKNESKHANHIEIGCNRMARDETGKWPNPNCHFHNANNYSNLIFIRNLMNWFIVNWMMNEIVCMQMRPIPCRFSKESQIETSSTPFFRQRANGMGNMNNLYMVRLTTN